MRYLLVILAGIFIWGFNAFGQPLPDERNVVELRVRGLEKKEVNILVKNNEAYLPVVTVFDFLGIRADYDSTAIKVDGFFKTPDSSYVIDPTAGFAAIDGRSVVMTDQDYAVIGNELLVRMAIINELLGLDITYNPRRLIVEVRRFKDLPAYVEVQRHRRLQQMEKRQNLIPSPDLTLGREVSVLGPERLDWSLTSHFTSSQYTESRYTLALGAQVLGGDGTARLVGLSEPLIHLNQNNLQGQVRFPFLDNQVVRQVIVGDYTVMGIQPRTVTGIEITDRPLAQRYFFTREVFRGQFEPNNDVELRGGIAGFQLQQTNDEGMYQFNLPIIYGEGNMEIHAYDPWGQERVLRYRLNVPRTLLPPGEIEYSLSGGRIRPPLNMLTSSGYFNYGVSSQLTVGGRVEYYDLGTPTDKFYTALTGTSLLTRGLAFNAIVAPSAVSQAGFDWLFPNYAEVSITGQKYADNAFFNPTQRNDNVNATVSLPFTWNGSSLAVGLFGEQSTSPGYRDRQFQFSLSGMFSIFSPAYSSSMSWQTDEGTGITSRLTYLSDASLAVYLPAGVVAMAELMYDQLAHQAEDIRVQVFKRLPNSLQIMMMYERLPLFQSYNVGLQIQYYFPSFRIQGNFVSNELKQSAYATMESGSISFDPKFYSLLFENSPSYVGYGGMIVHPFLDANGNGIQDRDEETIDKGRIYFADISRQAMPSNLAPDRLYSDRLPVYEEYDIYLDPQSLDNPIWVPEFSSIRMLSQPNDVKRINIPVVNGGSVHGTVSLADGAIKPLEGITVKITALGNGQGGKGFSRAMSTFSTGEFQFDLVPPGSYIVELDPNQPQMRGYESQPRNREVAIVAKADGDVVTGVDFVLKAR